MFRRLRERSTAMAVTSFVLSFVALACAVIAVGFVLISRVDENRGVLCDLGALVKVSPISFPIRLDSETEREFAQRISLVSTFKEGHQEIDCQNQGILAR